MKCFATISQQLNPSSSDLVIIVFFCNQHDTLVEKPDNNVYFPHGTEYKDTLETLKYLTADIFSFDLQEKDEQIQVT